MEQPTQGKRFQKRFGGALCLDFVNTVNGHSTIYHPHKKIHAYEALHDYDDLVRWGEHAGILSGAQVQALRKAALRQPVEAKKVFKQALTLRETLYRIFAPLALGQSPEAGDIQELNRVRSKILAQSRIEITLSGFQIAWQRDPRALDVPLTPIVLSAVELVTSESLAQLRACAGDTCEWLFLD